MILKRIGVLSAAKIAGALYTLIGLIIGAVISLISLVGAGMGGGTDALFGVGAIIIFPILYGVLGFLGAALGAFLYNWIAGYVGGIEFELVAKAPESPYA